MIEDVDSFAHLSFWIVNALYCISFIPQIALNYKNRSVQGISDLTLIGFMFGYLASIFYVFTSSMPTPYKFFVPLSFLCTLILSFQRIYYHRKQSWQHFMIAWTSMACLSLLAILFAISNLNEIGHVMGWIAAGIWSVYQLPQLAKILKSKSVHGISFLFISLMGTGVIIELISAIIVGLPLPSLLNLIRALISYGTLMFLLVIFRSRAF